MARQPECPRWALMVTPADRILCVRECLAAETRMLGWHVVARESELLPWPPGDTPVTLLSNPRRQTDPPQKD